jgi:predicted outer membrane repeat protein
VWLVGAADATTLRPASPTERLLVSLASGAPRVHITGVRLLGRLRVGGGELRLSNCSIEVAAPARRHLTDSALDLISDRACSITGGEVVFTRTTMSGHAAGAIAVGAASLTLIECGFFGNTAQSGGAMLVTSAAVVTIVRSIFDNNTAVSSGGALQVQPCSARHAVVVQACR